VEPNYLLYLEVSPHWTPVRNVVATLPVQCTLQGVPRGDRCDLCDSPLVGDWGNTPEAKNKCKML